MTSAAPTRYQEAREKLLYQIKAASTMRALWQIRWSPQQWDSDEEKMKRAVACLAKLEMWSRDLVLFVEEMGWSPDPQGLFGGGPNTTLPSEWALEDNEQNKRRGIAFTPPRMVPILLSVPQREFLRSLQTMLETDGKAHINLLKSRQVAATTLVLWFIVWGWLFKPSFKALVGSYAEDVIDAGGKGHREGDSLFARLRMLIDAVMICMPQLAFNQHRAQKWISEQFSAGNVARFDTSEDMKNRLKRPKWTVYKGERYKDAKGNTIKGVLPSDTFSKGDSFSVILLDEFGDYAKLGQGVDRAARGAALPCCQHIITQGTIPADGGLDSEFKTLADRGDTPTLTNIKLHWTDIYAYMLGAYYRCPHCQSETPYDIGRAPMKHKGPGEKGRECVCSKCGATHRVTRNNPDDPYGVTSPYFEIVKDDLNHNPVAIARYYNMDWYAAIGDRAFYTFDYSQALVPRKALVEEDRWVPIDGYDPGWSEKNPAAWLLAMFSEKLQKIRILAYHMAAHWRTDKWVPFFKRIPPARIYSNTHPYILPYGPSAGQAYKNVHHLRPEEIELLERIQRIPMGEYEADKYGSHQTAAGESEFKVLERFGVYFRYEYTVDRGDLIGKARDLWVPRMEIDPAVEDYRPMSPSGRPYPSLVDCFTTARMVDTKTGQAQTRKDINKNEPWSVSHPIDAFLYLCRALPDEVHAAARSDGTFSPEDGGEPQVVIFGETFEGQFTG